MPLPTPILDDRSWQQLRDELVRRIPVYTPEWTDHNPSDPGITLLELFAFLGENLLFRFNQVPEATRLEFLRLAGASLRPAAPARAMLAMRTREPKGALAPIGTEARAGSVAFETRDEVRAWPLSARAAGRRATDPAPGSDAALYAEAAIAARGLRPGEVAATYVTDVLGDDPAKAGFVPLDLGPTVDRTLWVAVLGQKETRLEDLEGGVLNLGFIPDPEVPEMDEVPPCPGAGAEDGTDEIVWEILLKDLLPDGEPEYRALPVVGDTTGGLSRQGVVRLRLPGDAALLGVPVVEDARMGTGSLPPVLEDEELADALCFWLRAWRRQGGQPLGRVLWVGANAAEALQLRTARAELLGTGTGAAGQTYPLGNRGVLRGSLELEVEEAGGWTPWTEAENLWAAGRDDRAFVLDAEAGTVTFGDGVRGRVPGIGERVRVRSYRHGGGAAGNVAAKAINRVAAPGITEAGNPRPAFGGEDAEPVADALERIPAALRTRDRAVTAEDFRRLARETPGAGVGRAEVLARFHPPTRRMETAGVVTVVVWPQEDAESPDAPRPDRDLLRCVCAYLDARRLITTELYVVPPTYRKIAVSVGLSIKPGFGVEAVRAWVEVVLRQYLAPLPPFGPEGEGWPLGRRVHGPELEAAALQVEGVEYLEGLDVAAWSDAENRWVPGTVVLHPWEVPHLAQLTVVEGPPEPVGAALAPPPDARVAVPIPTVRDEC